LQVIKASLSNHGCQFSMGGWKPENTGCKHNTSQAFRLQAGHHLESPGILETQASKQKLIYYFTPCLPLSPASLSKYGCQPLPYLQSRSPASYHSQPLKLAHPGPDIQPEMCAFPPQNNAKFRHRNPLANLAGPLRLDGVPATSS
jgi:hypothetical protein